MVSPSRLTFILATLKSVAIGPSWAVAMRPPVATIAIITYISQKCEVEAISMEVKSEALWRRLTSAPAGAFRQVFGSQPSGGALRKNEQNTTTAPCTMPHVTKVDWYPDRSIILAIGTTVNAAPAPNPAAVSPAARPR